MGIEKRSSNYVGGFLQLFDWNAKSRKKLMFSNKPDLPENSKQKKKFDGTSPTTRLQMMDEDETGDGSSVKGGSEYSRASSVTEEDLCGSKGPGVVARLMGLNSMPKSNTIDPSSTPLFDCYYKNENLECKRDEEVSSEPKYQKVVVMRPMQKFQTEILPPKSAKSIPITHHKLMSPIKSTNYVPSKDKAEIMESAARILEPGRKTKVQKVQKSLRMSESSQKSGELSRKTNTTPMRILRDSEECSSSVKSKGRSISLALQAKANVQKREGLSSRRPVSNTEKNESSSPNMLFTSQKSTSNVLRQNNQKQNCSIDRAKSTKGDSPSTRRQNSSKLVGNSKSSSKKLNSQVKVSPSCSSSERMHKKRSVDEVSVSESEKTGTDVISFTFTAPMRSNEEGKENCKKDYSPNKRMMLNSDSFTFLGHNVKGGDTLSRYLEQQLEELAHKVDSISQHKSKEQKNYLVSGQKMQGTCGRNIIEDHSFRLPSPVSVFEHSSFTESCHSSESNRSTNTGASSNSGGPLTKSKNWELNYVNRVLQCNIDHMFNEYALGRTCEIINPNLFDQLEKSCNDCGPVSRTSRRLVFDCVSECLDRRCRKHGVGGWTLWAKGVWMLKQKDRLIEDVCKEISGLSSMGDFMVDGLVDRDMSSDPWLDYDAQGFEIGVKIEARILNSLIDEVVADILLL